MRCVLAFAVLCAAALPAWAQLALPGATAPAPVGTVIKPAATKPRPTGNAAPRAVTPASPAETALAGKTLALNGGKSQITFAAHDKTVEIARLLLVGSKAGGSRDECQVEISGMPMTLSALGKADGLSRFSVAVPDCPFDLAVLDGAILTSSSEASCRFPAVGCQAVVTGLWGPSAGAIGPDAVKTIDRERMGAERSVRAAYKGLVASTKDRAVIRAYASDQAGFSSYREERCRDYVGETRHGFCASRLTQSRAIRLEAELVTASAAKQGRRKTHAR